MKSKIYVVMHKILNIDLDTKLYRPILVGSYNKQSENILRDDDGENISYKNENYCELTGLYWIWKNATEDIVGLCHYRRFFTKNSLSNSKKFFLNSEDIFKLFNKKKINMILPKKFIYKTITSNTLKRAPSKEDMKILRKAIKAKYPEYLDDYDNYMNGKFSYLCNVFITKKEICDKYCKWLFDILFFTEEIMDKEDYVNDTYRKRMFGFLSERLLNIWILHNKESLKIKEYELVNIEIKPIRKTKHLLKQKFRMLKYKKNIR